MNLFNLSEYESKISKAYKEKSLIQQKIHQRILNSIKDSEKSKCIEKKIEDFQKCLKFEKKLASSCKHCEKNAKIKESSFKKSFHLSTKNSSLKIITLIKPPSRSIISDVAYVDQLKNKLEGINYKIRIKKNKTQKNKENDFEDEKIQKLRFSQTFKQKKKTNLIGSFNSFKNEEMFVIRRPKTTILKTSTRKLNLDDEEFKMKRERIKNNDSDQLISTDRNYQTQSYLENNNNINEKKQKTRKTVLFKYC